MVASCGYSRLWLSVERSSTDFLSSPQIAPIPPKPHFLSQI
jgi:hypothetical protein